jgi:tRNA U34 5-methylaminomethyl-2-thiouridine-forming methyltransferase MnmC
MNNDGNRYQFEILDNGVVTFRHVPTREILHGSVGPEKEARELYLNSSGIRDSSKKSLLVFDLGMGCGAQLMMLLDFLAAGESQCELLRVWSFDLEKNGLITLLSAAEHFPQVERHRKFIERAIAENQITLDLPNGRKVEWKFVAGDFRTTIHEKSLDDAKQKTDAIFYDFFSPASHPWLWTVDLFEKLHEFAHDKTTLVTFSSATCVKASMAAGGWYVGQTIASGKKSPSIVAAGSLSALKQPLTKEFLSTFERSHKAFSDAETEEGRELIRSRMRNHPQFAK